MWRYRFAGLNVESAIHLPEWESFVRADTGVTPDVRITLDDDDASGDVDVSVPDVARFRIAGGERIVVTPATGSSPAEVRLYLLGSALAAVCQQRGVLLLHASVTSLSGKAVALCGPAKSGKSTLAAALVDRGATFVCDDLGRFDAHDGRVWVHPSTPRMKLSPEALDTLGWPIDRFTRVHPKTTKLHVPQHHADPWTPVPLHAICVLEWADGPARAARLTGAAGLAALVAAATYRPGLLESNAQLAVHWQQCAALAAGVPIYRVTRAQSWSAIDGAVAAIAAVLLTARAPMP
jgi:hypothetical protein